MGEGEGGIWRKGKGLGLGGWAGKGEGREGIMRVRGRGKERGGEK